MSKKRLPKALLLGLVAAALLVPPAPVVADAVVPVPDVAARPHAEGACGATDPVPPLLADLGLVEYTEDPAAGTWQTWFVGPGDIVVPPPPDVASLQTANELLELQQIALTRTNEQIIAAQQWDFNGGAASAPWTDIMLQLIIKHSAKDGSKNPPRLSREFAMFETAIFDALTIAWDAKYCYLRPPPAALDPLLALDPIVAARSVPTYPSEHAVVAGVAEAFFPHLFPCPDPTDVLHCEEPVANITAQSLAAAESRIIAVQNYRSDIDAGLQLGRDVANAVMAARADDGWLAPIDLSDRIFGACRWVPTPPAFRAIPVEPEWGGVTPFLMTSGDQFRPPEPGSGCDTDDYVAQHKDIYYASKPVAGGNLSLVPGATVSRAYGIANYWAGGQGTETPPGQNLYVAWHEANDAGLSTMQHARVLAHEGAALADAAIASWDAKFAYWWERPVTWIRENLDPTWSSSITTPPFPGYISGHSTFSGATEKVLAHFFPDHAWKFRAYASEAALSRYIGGIHVRFDNNVGLEVGNSIGNLAAARAAGDGAE
jgi:hypothetical protein